MDKLARLDCEQRKKAHMQTIKILAIAVMAIGLAAGPADANWREIHVQYFTDSQLDNLVGESTDWCDDSTSSWGTLAGAYVGHWEVNCSTDEVMNVSCYHWTGTTYEPISCYHTNPLHGSSEGGRLRVPIG
jgi:Family of unknown function (DUF6289)